MDATNDEMDISKMMNSGPEPTPAPRPPPGGPTDHQQTYPPQLYRTPSSISNASATPSSATVHGQASSSQQFIPSPSQLQRSADAFSQYQSPIGGPPSAFPPAAQIQSPQPVRFPSSGVIPPQQKHAGPGPQVTSNAPRQNYQSIHSILGDPAQISPNLDRHNGPAVPYQSPVSVQPHSSQTLHASSLPSRASPSVSVRQPINPAMSIHTLSSPAEIKAAATTLPPAPVRKTTQPSLSRRVSQSSLHSSSPKNKTPKSASSQQSQPPLPPSPKTKTPRSTTSSQQSQPPPPPSRAPSEISVNRQSIEKTMTDPTHPLKRKKNTANGSGPDSSDPIEAPTEAPPEASAKPPRKKQRRYAEPPIWACKAPRALERNYRTPYFHGDPGRGNVPFVPASSTKPAGGNVKIEAKGTTPPPKTRKDLDIDAPPPPEPKRPPLDTHRTPSRDKKTPAPISRTPTAGPLPPSRDTETPAPTTKTPIPGPPPPQDASPLGPWEPSITNHAPFRDITRQVADFLFEQVFLRPDTNTPPSQPGPKLEIEAKLGRIIDRATNQRLALPISSECILDASSPALNIRFEAGVTPEVFARTNRFLNQALEDSLKPPPNVSFQKRIPLLYTHRREVDTFHVLPGDPATILSQLPPSIVRDADIRSPPRLRLTHELGSGKLLASIVKVRVKDLHLYNPSAAVDCRISVSLEMEWPLTEDERRGLRPEARSQERSKDRISYRHLAFSVDLTEVGVVGGRAEHELEVEVEAQRVRALAEHAQRFGSPWYEVLVKGFLDNVRVLARLA